MTNYLKVLDLIKLETSGKEKERILKTNDSVELREYLSIALDKDRVYHVKKFPTGLVGDKVFSSVSGKGFIKFKNLIKLLETNEISGHLAQNTIFDCFGSFTPKEQEWYRKALLKEAINIGREIVNKAFPKLVNKFVVMLAPNTQPDLDNIKYPKIIQPKIDGFRAIYIPGQGLVGRNGKKIRNTNLHEHFLSLYMTNTHVFDGELYCHGVGFNKVASVLNSAAGVIPFGLKYHVFDGMTTSEWAKKKCSTKYEDRLSTFQELDKVAPLKNVNVLGAEKVSSKQEAMNKYSLYIKGGYEGAMLKDPDSIYTWKRVTLKSEVLLKVKPYVTEDLKIVGCEEGEGKYVGKLGKLIVDYKGVSVGVGTGFTDEERSSLWSQKNALQGRFIEVRGMEITADKSIRHPVYIRFRDDK